MKIITRFAPSPTGDLHIGSARTALFNYLFSKHHNGKFLLRIEDTDKKRSTQEAIDVILEGMKWLGLNWDDKVIFQTDNISKHVEIAMQLLANGNAYKCFLSTEELNILREESRKNGKKIVSPWRNKDTSQYPKNKEFVVRIKVPEGETIINDIVQGEVKIRNEIIEDFIILRSDLTPTYMLSSVVDDFDMAITHVIRGDDHLNNTAKQILIYQAMNWNIPKFAHIPLIHAEDGSKLSKRHGALSVMEYKNMGYIPQALCNYLLRLGWSHKDDEIIPQDQAIKWFNLEAIGKSAARMDYKKLDYLNSHYLNQMSNDEIIDIIKDKINDLTDLSLKSIKEAIPHIKQRSKNTNDLAQQALIFTLGYEIKINSEFISKFNEHKEIFKEFYILLKSQNDWNRDSLMNQAKEYATKHNIKLGELVYNFRLALTGSNNSPSIFDIMAIIGKEESLKRIEKYV